MIKRMLSCVLLISIFLVTTVTADNETVEWKYIGEIWYRCIAPGLWVPVPTMPEILVEAQTEDPGDPITAFRISQPELTYIRHNEEVDEWKIWRESRPDWIKITKPTISLRLDKALEDGKFLSNESNEYRVYATTNLITDITWESEGISGSGSLSFAPEHGTSPLITFSVPPVTSARSTALEYKIKAIIVSAEAEVDFD
ncbi:MAG: hypothetical protein OXH06_00315 [Gemmatimonadetes bacterium]|nr:hypothetical protein [Gemmatimonadota bacterium]